MKQMISMSIKLYKSRFTSILGMFALTMVVSSALSSFIYVLALPASWLLSGVLAVVMMKETEGKPTNVSDMLAIGKNNFLRLLGCNALVTLKVCLWMLIPIAGVFIGIVKAYSYSFAIYVAYSQPNLPLSECIRTSERLTRGKKKEMFLIDLAFGGLILLSLLPMLLVLVLLFAIPDSAATLAGLLIGPASLFILAVYVLIGPVQGLIRARYFVDSEMMDGYGSFIVNEYPPEDGQKANAPAEEEVNEKKQEF